MHKSLLLFLLGVICLSSSAQRVPDHTKQAYKAAWEALDQNHFDEARKLLLQAVEDPQEYEDAVSSLIILDNYLGKEHQIIESYHDPLMRMGNQQDYFYAFWFTEACLGTYGKLDSLHRQHLEYILSHSDRFNGSMQAAAHYFRSIDEMATWHMPMSLQDAGQIHALTRWAVTGPFENAGGSGFNQPYGPVYAPQDSTGFKAYNGTRVKWFIPRHMENASWVFLKTAFPDTKGLAYAQTFVKAEQEVKGILCIGGAGSLKVWVNDKLLFSQSKERITELDTYKVPCTLNQGYNRILIQVGYANTALPNFIVRLTDENYRPLDNLAEQGTYHAYQKDTSSSRIAEIPLFSEAFFQKKIEGDPANPVNYLLLAKTFLRNQKGYQSQKLLSPLLEKHPKNVLILYQYLLSLQAENNQTGKLEYLEKIKALHPRGFLSLYNNMSQQEANKNYTNAIDSMDLIDRLIGPDPILLAQRIKLVAYTGQSQQLLTLIKQGCDRYPDKATFPLVLYSYYKNASNNPAEALQALEKYNNRLFNAQVAVGLSGEYITQGQFEKGMDLLKKLLRLHPESNDICNDIVLHYYQQNNMDSAITYLGMLKENMPYAAQPDVDLASCYLQKGDTVEAIKYLREALSYDPSLYSSRQKLRTLTHKPELSSYFPFFDVNKEIADNLAHPYDSLHHYYYIFDTKNTTVYAEGVDEEEVRTAIYIRDDKGVDQFSDMYIPYNNNFQVLTIEKAQVVKADGSVIPAETNDNEVVFSKIEAGDAIYYQYKLRNYGTGRIGREFWDKFYYSAGVPTRKAQYNLLIAKQIPFHYQIASGKDIKPKVSSHEDFQLYNWTMNDISALKDEYLMPPLVDVGTVLHISTVSSWNEISSWYSDITHEQAENSLETEQLIQELFPGGIKGLSDLTKAHVIYDYVVQHIAYSSVAFLQSAYVPQKASRTLTTKLGDCKDIATLFVALATKVGVEANLVLVNTRDNGQQAMRLPSLGFNHCIARIVAGGQDYYMELTDKNLPFLALPDNLYGAQALNIPAAGSNHRGGLVLLRPESKRQDQLIRKISVNLTEKDLSAHSDLCVSGALSSGYRSRYKHEIPSDVQETIKQNLSQVFKKSVNVDSVRFSGLDHLSDSVQQHLAFRINNEVIAVGKMHVWKPVFIDMVASPDLFTVSERKYPMEYWQYENTDQYKTTLEVNLPPGQSFKQIPEDVNYHFNQMSYQLTYHKLSAHQMVIEREFTTQPWKDIAAKDYQGLESFFRKITDAESRYLSF